MHGTMGRHKDEDNISSFSLRSLKFKRLVSFHTILNLERGMLPG